MSEIEGQRGSGRPEPGERPAAAGRRLARAAVGVGLELALPALLALAAVSVLAAPPGKWATSTRLAPAPESPAAPAGPWRVLESFPAGPAGRAGSLALVVEAGLYSSISTELAAYAELLRAEGWSVSIDAASGGTAADLRALLAERHAQGAGGALLAGDLPVALARLEHDFGADVFPIDLFFMDLDGDWIDADQDGIYEGHAGAAPADIWVGRLRAGPLTATGQSEADLMRAYLTKAATYRLADPVHDLAPLAYADLAFGSDTWEGAEALSFLYGRAERVADGSLAGYRQELAAGRPWISTYAHGSPALQIFGSGNLWATDLPGLGIETPFFLDFSCSNARYTAGDYMGGWYVFSPVSPLGLFGSTKTGSLFYVADLAGELDRGGCLGEAYLEWSRRHSEANPAWLYGATLLGDPTLTVLRQPMIEAVATSDPAGDGDGRPEAGETVELEVTLRSRLGRPLAGLTAMLASASAEVEVVSGGPIEFGPLAPGEAASAGPLSIALAETLAGGARPALVLQLAGAGGESWSRPLHLEIAGPELRLGPPWVDDGGDGWLAGGETAWLHLRADNLGTGDLAAAGYQVESGSPFLVLSGGGGGPLALAPGESAWLAPVEAELDALCPPGTLLPVRLAMTGGGPSDTVVLVAGGGLAFDAELGWGGLRHGPATPHAVDEWQRAGAAFRCGGTQGRPYAAGADGALELPPVLVSGEAYLEFEHGLEGEPGDPGTAYDGALVEVDAGAGFVPLEPESGYPAVFEVGTTLPPGVPCWAEVPAWTAERCRLPNSAGPVRLRLRFASDGGVALGGWDVRGLRLAGELVLPTPEPTPEPTPPPPSPTPGPSATPSPAPTATPEPTPAGPSLALELENGHLRPGELFGLDLAVANPGPPAAVDFYLVLDVHGSYFGWPDWDSEVPGLRAELPAGLEARARVLEFVWPDGAGADSGLIFWAALLDPGGGALLDWDQAWWSYGP